MVVNNKEVFTDCISYIPFETLGTDSCRQLDLYVHIVSYREGVEQAARERDLDSLVPLMCRLEEAKLQLSETFHLN